MLPALFLCGWRWCATCLRANQDTKRAAVLPYWELFTANKHGVLG